MVRVGEFKEEDTIFFIGPIKGIFLRGKQWDYMILRFTT
jgi:hypothetical protein